MNLHLSDVDAQASARVPHPHAIPGPGPARAPLTPKEIRIILSGIMLAMFLAALNQTIVATALPTIGRELHDFENLSWIITSYLLTSTAVAPLYGKMADIHGRRTMMLAGTGLFVAGSAICGAAPNMIVLVIGRGLQGLGGGGLLPLVQIIIADVVAPRERGRYQAFIGSVWVAAGISGPVVGGFFAEHLHWSLIFWINVPVGLAGILISHVTLKRLPIHHRWHQLDLLGAALMMAAATSLLLALTSGGTRFPWGSLPIIGLIALSGLLWAAFAVRLTRASEPFLPLTVLNNPVVRWGCVASACAVGTSIGLTVYVPLYYEIVHHLSASDSGLALIPVAVMTTPGSVASSRSMMYLKHYKRVALAFVSLAIAAILWLAWMPGLPLAAVMVLLGVIGFGLGTVFPLCTVCIQNAVPLPVMGTATGVMNFSRALNSALIVAVMGAIVLAGFGVTPERGRGAEALMAATSALSTDHAGIFRWVFAAAAVFMLIGLLALIRMEEWPLRGRAATPAKTGFPEAPGAE